MANNQSDNSEFENLAKKYLEGTISPEEQTRFEAWYAGFNDEALQLKSDRYDSAEELRKAMYQRIQDRMINNRKKNIIYSKIAVAALILVCLSFVFILYFPDKPSTFENSVEIVEATNIGPGRSTASLILDNGVVIDLDKLKDGDKVDLIGTSLQKNVDGEIEIKVSDIPVNNTNIEYSTIRTPKGGNYKIVLADGTQVWLNSSSSLKFPTVFDKAERIVELVGEAYFDVVSNKNRLFKVISDGQEINVLGTQFNVAAYLEDRNIKTTLIEGSVKVSTANHSLLIEPGEQSIITKEGFAEIVNVDVSNIVAWKDGFFAFDKLNVEEVMNQISRWYNVKVSFKNEVPKKQLIGKISKKENLSTVLQMLTYNGINIEFKNNTIIIK